MARRGTRNRSTRKGRKRSWKDSGLVWFAGAAVALALLILPTLNFSPSDHHPEPRQNIPQGYVAPAAQYAAYPRVAEIYGQVAEIPEVVDGIFCYCMCEKHSGHYSLLDCYKDGHASRCDICLSEGSMAYRMHQDGKSIDAIRTAVDRLYET